jgi:hypothetical protein
MFILFFFLIVVEISFATSLSCSEGYSSYAHEIWTAGRADSLNLQTDILRLSGEESSIDIEKIWTYDTSTNDQRDEAFKIVFMDANSTTIYAQTDYSKDVDNHQGANHNSYTDLGVTLLPKGVKIAKLVHRADAQYGENLKDYNSVTFKGLCYKINYLNRDIDKRFKIGDFVWADLNRDGIQNDNEVGLAGITIELYKGESKIAESITDEYGHYEFKNLPSADYRLKCIIKDGWAVTKRDVNSNSHDFFDSDANESGEIMVNIERDYNSYDIGLYLKERAVLEVEIETTLNDPKNAIVGDTVEWVYIVKNRGNVKLSSLRLSDKEEGEILCPKHILFANEKMVCRHKSIIENGFHKNLLSITGYLPSGERLGIQREDFYIGKESLNYQGSIGDRVWLDANRNGIQDSRESGISGVEVQLYDHKNRLISSTKTNENGNYFFEKIRPRLYYLKVTIPKGYLPTRPKQGEDKQQDSNLQKSGWSDLFRVGVSEDITDQDFGLYIDYSNPTISVK